MSQNLVSKKKLVSNIWTGSVIFKTTQKGNFIPIIGQIMEFFFFCDKSLKLSRKKQEQNYSLFFGVVATMAATFAKKSFFEEITSSEKVRVKIFEQKTSEHAINLA